MKKNIRAAAAGVLVLAVTVSATIIFPSSALADQKTQTYEQQIAAYEQQQKEAEARRQEALQNMNDAAAYKAALEESYELMGRKLETYSSMIVELDKQIDEKSSLIIETEKKIEDTRKQFLGRMASMYEDGNASYLEVILGAKDISDFLTRVDNISVMMEYDQKLIASLTEDKQTLNTALKELEEARKSQEEAFATLQNDKEAYAALIAEANESISQYKDLMESAEQDRMKARAAEDQIDGELSAYLAELAEKERLEKLQQQQQQQQNSQNNSSGGSNTNYYTPAPIVNNASGDFMWPLTSYVYISSHFGGRILNGSYDFHGATDIATPEGTPIYAAGSGTVVRSEWNNSYGYYVLIDHGNGKSTLYAHQCQPPFVNAGDNVTIGQNIGLVGNTGDSFGAHLHFEFRINGQKVDPEQYVTPPHQ